MDSDEKLFQELRRLVRDTPSAGEAGPGDALEHRDAVPGYVLHEELHRGGQGVVYRALQRTTHRVVALKVLLGGRHASARDRVRFEREIDLASRLRHPDIVTIYDSGIADGRPWFAMEHVEGDRLDAYLAERDPPLAERLRLFQRISCAVAAAHRRGVIHRDLKPSNILVDAEGAPHILDFGIAKTLESEGGGARVTATGEFMGTLAYASPEQVQGDPADVDTRTDVYSLGVLLYEISTGRLPYDVTGHVSGVIESITSRPPADPRAFSPGFDAELWTVLATALAKDPAERYPSAEAFARDVGHFLAGEPIEARGRSTWYVLRKAIARHRLPVSAAAAALVLAAGAAFVLVREHLRAERRGERELVVREILQDVLSAAAPERMGSGVTLLEIYDEAAGRIETALENAPDAQAAFHLTIGETYRSLLMWPEAEAHLSKALERYRAVDDRRGLEVARCLNLLGLVLCETDPPRALPVEEEALALRRAALGDDDVRVAESERSLAVALTSQYAAREHERPQALLLSALEKYTRALGARHPEVAATKFQLARIAQWSGRLEDARMLLEEARAIYELEPEGTDPRIVDCLGSLASVDRDLGRFDEARAFLDRAVELTSRLYGEERDVEMLRSYANLAYAKEDFATAERLTRQALAKELGRWAKKRPDDRARLSDLQERLLGSDPPAAEPPYAEAFAVLREYRGKGAFELAMWANGIVRTMVPQGRGPAAEPLLREALQVGCRAFGRDCPIRMDTLWLLSKVLADDGRPDDAVPLLEELVATFERTGDGGDDDRREARELLERCRAAGTVEVGLAGPGSR